MSNLQRAPGPIYVTTDLRREPWHELRGGSYREGEVYRVGRYEDAEAGPVLAQWVRLTDGSDALVYTPLNQAIEAARRLGGRHRDPLSYGVALFWATLGITLGLSLAFIAATFHGWV